MSEARFTPELFDFLRELKQNNSRDWFQKHSLRFYAVVQEPLLAFIGAFAEPLAAISTQLVADPRATGKCLARIYRDVQYAKNKNPYKTHVAAKFRHRQGRDLRAPGFYLHLEPGNVYAGAGIWHSDSKTLHKIRTAIVENPKGWTAAVSKPEFVSRHVLCGEYHERPPQGFSADHPLIGDIKRKDYVTKAPFTEEEACDAEFLEVFVATCEAAAGFMRFLTRSLGLGWRSRSING